MHHSTEICHPVAFTAPGSNKASTEQWVSIRRLATQVFGNEEPFPRLWVGKVASICTALQALVQPNNSEAQVFS